MKVPPALPRAAASLDQPPAHATIGVQLLLAVNLTAAALVALFLAYDYHRELAGRLADKRIALEEEAKTLLPALLQIRHEGLPRVQRFVDSVCGQMRDADSPWHHIAVQLGQQTVQALAHHRESPEILQAMRAAAASPNRRAPFGATELVVGTHARDGVTVYVSEALEAMRKSVVQDVARRLAGVVVLALVAAVVVNWMLARIVVRPLNHLVYTVQKIAAGQLGVQAGSLRSAELSFLANEINEMSTSLAASQRDRSAQLAKARRIQQHLLPTDLDRPGLKVASLFQPADVVAGDYYDILNLVDDSWLVCVADVTGHGVPAAMNAAVVKAILRQATEHLTSPAEILAYVNRRFFAVSLLGDFASMFLMRVSPQTGRASYASAGHETAYVLRSARSRRGLPSTGIVLGVDEEAGWDEEPLAAATGDRVLIVTDGVVEAQNARQECFGRERIRALFAACHALSLDQAAERIDLAVTAFRQGARPQDDVTVLLIEFDAPS